MDILSFKTVSANSATAQKGWIIVDADSAVLGRLISRVAYVLRGKNKTNFTPNVDCGDNVIIINADKIRLTGKKWDEKEYISHSGYPGGQKTVTPKMLKARSSKLVLESAIKGMLPKNRLGRKLFNNVFIYEGAEHPHAAQQPKEVKL